jgi:hypothetical protein
MIESSHLNNFGLPIPFSIIVPRSIKREQKNECNSKESKHHAKKELLRVHHSNLQSFVLLLCMSRV